VVTESREALARALYEAEGFHAADSWETETAINRGRCEGHADHLIASGAVTVLDPDDDALVERVEGVRMFESDRGASPKHAMRRALSALASSAGTEGGEGQ